MNGGVPPGSHIYFPISDSAKKYKTESPAKTKRIGPAAIKAIDASRPYKGGNDLLWVLHKLNIVDKHRLLLTVVGLFHSVNVASDIGVDWRAAFGKDFPLTDLWLQSADKIALKVGDELFSGAPEAEFNKDINFKVEISLAELGIVEGQPLVKTLQEMLDPVDSIILSFKPLLI